MADVDDAELVTTQVHARAVHLLRTRGDQAAADLLAACTLEVVVDTVGEVGLELVGPLVTQAGPLDLERPMAHTLAQVLREALPPGVWIERLLARPPGEPLPSPPWRRSLPIQRSQADQTTPSTTGMTGLNQAIGELAPRMWSGIRFRSESELRIAQALDRAGVLFLPSALARLGPPSARQNREADFLVCVDGVWGILEVDGVPFHPDAQQEMDSAHDLLFMQHGIGIVRHFDAVRCFATPEQVVAEFLATLHQSRRRGG